MKAFVQQNENKIILFVFIVLYVSIYTGLSLMNNIELPTLEAFVDSVVSLMKLAFVATAFSICYRRFEIIFQERFVKA